MATQRWTDALVGSVSSKIQRLTLDTSDKFIWLDKNVEKLFWSNAEGQPACGSFSLINMIYVLVGQIAHDFVKGKVSYRDLKETQSTGTLPLTGHICFLNEKRDINFCFDISD